MSLLSPVGMQIPVSNYRPQPEAAGSMAFSAPAEAAGSVASASFGGSSSSSDSGCSFCAMA